MTGNRWTRCAQTAPISYRHDFESNHEPKQAGKKTAGTMRSVISTEVERSPLRFRGLLV
jgi:hypothetical protein